MARPRKFSRDGVLDKAIPVFWQFGLAGTNLQQLERATGVNKSGLYAEFDDKEDLFVAALQRYLETGPARRILAREPAGWDNIEQFLLQAPFATTGRPGCFSINSTRDVAGLPPRAVALIADHGRLRLQDIARNVRAERPDADAETIAGLIATFFSGACIDANLAADPDAHRVRVGQLMDMLRRL
ncbi:TetR/AcrR family transcriptional regulator [Geminicoccus roseus]|uniref:TetR/AcrR family transcriptional regulator n=1 Tax=Geminicoccus roseus TaxID=404900 RepID=UPI0004809E94|nr:TetR family transcriptional regulator [Geminicoccus roseus]